MDEMFFDLNETSWIEENTEIKYEMFNRKFIWTMISQRLKSWFEYIFEN